MEDNNAVLKTLHRVAIVTGGASGIGKAIVEALARQGDRVISTDVQAGNYDPALSTNIESILADLTERSACQYVIQETFKRHQRIDILVNNAGFQHVDPIEKFPEDTWDKMIALMLTAPFLLTRYAWPIMQAQQRGRIVNIASIHGVVA
jgi:3-hydroxybutyrate dehydrogenase